MKKIFTFLSLLLLVAVSHSQIRYLKCILQGAQEVPANASAATGVVIVKYNTATRFLDLVGNYQGFTSTVNNSHIHSPALPGVNAAVLINLTNTGGTAGTLKGTATLTAAQETDMFNGLMYVNVHTVSLPGGEIRGQLSATTDGQTDFFNGRLQGALQVPPNNSTGTGSVFVLLDKVKDSVYLTGNFSGLSIAANASHIHNGAAPGSNGPVFQNLVFTNATAGTLHVAASITAANKLDMVNGVTYVNIHNANFPGGEIRGQLTQLSQLRFLTATLSGSQEVPANASAGKGTVIVKYNPFTKYLELVGDYQNVSSTVNDSHIHSPAGPGVNAPVLITLANTGGTTGNVIGIATLTTVQEADLLNGLMYVNVHTANNPGGEIRGQLIPVTGQAEIFTGTFQGSQETPIPGNGSSATGFVSVLLDKTNLKVYVSGNFSGLTANATAGHLHQGIVGVAGPIIVPLSVTASTSGTITGSLTVSPGFADSMIRGYTYANIHNPIYPGGEVRAQLGDVVLPLKLNYFNGYKKGNLIALVWETAQEINVRHFEVEQQDANGAWIKKATVAATGGNNTNKYNLEDVPAISKNEYVLYRLKMVDADGRFTYSPVIRINFMQSKAGLSIMTNPVTNGSLAFTVTGLATDQKAAIMIADYNGRVVFRSTASTLQNNRLDIGKLSAGMYKLMINLNGTVLQESFSKY